MRCMRRRSLVLLALLFGGVWLATEASAQATTVPTTGFQVFLATLDPGTSFISEDGVLHVRNQVNLFHQYGDLDGDVVVTGNVELDLATFTGRATAKASFSGTYTPSGVTGTFDGSAVTDIAPGLFHTQGVLQGGGGFEGMKRFSDVVATNSFFATYSGYILDPSGALQ